jgi:uncharacterized protein DUF3883
VTLHRQESLFTMSALNGLLAIRRYSIAHPNILLREVVTAIRHISVDDAYHNYEAAAVLHGLVTPLEGLETDVSGFYREIITTLVREMKPWWVRLSPSGRDRVKAALSVNEVQCFDAAGLFSQPPPPEILRWWDALAQEVRTEDDARLLEQGRAAEQLTMEYETERLAALGISNRPLWISLDDNSAGYDVHSYSKGPVEPVAKLIEVKSTVRQPREIFITRNEWKTALDMTPNYYFHIWTLPDKQLVELTPADIEPSIPANRGNGSWQIVKVTL